MSKLYKKYLELKNFNNQKIYLFKSGIFYIALDRDAEMISSLMGFKLTNFNDIVKKCGFPIKSLEKYKNRMEQLEISFVIVDNVETIPEYIENELIERIKYIEKINLDDITPIEAISILNKLQEALKNE